MFYWWWEVSCKTLINKFCSSIKFSNSLICFCSSFFWLFNFIFLFEIILYSFKRTSFSLFELTKTHFPLGGNVGVVTYSLDGYIEDNIFPGNFDALNSAGIIVPERYFPQFDISLKTNNFLDGENVTSGNIIGKVENWNSRIELLKVSTASEFSIDDIIVGETSHTQGKVTSKINFNAEVKLNAGSVVKKGWTRDTGFFNNNLERLPDNNYYQNFRKYQ